MLDSQEEYRFSDEVAKPRCVYTPPLRANMPLDIESG